MADISGHRRSWLSSTQWQAATIEMEKPQESRELTAGSRWRSNINGCSHWDCYPPVFFQSRWCQLAAVITGRQICFVNLALKLMAARWFIAIITVIFCLMSHRRQTSKPAPWCCSLYQRFLFIYFLMIVLGVFTCLEGYARVSSTYMASNDDLEWLNWLWT